MGNRLRAEMFVSPGRQNGVAFLIVWRRAWAARARAGAAWIPGIQASCVQDGYAQLKALHPKWVFRKGIDIFYCGDSKWIHIYIYIFPIGPERDCPFVLGNAELASTYTNVLNQR